MEWSQEHRKYSPQIWPRERSGSVVECLTRHRGAAGLSLTGVTMLCQPRKTLPYITERMLMGRKESNQTNKQIRPV